MSSASDDEGPVSPRAAPKKEENVTQQLANLSGDESDDVRAPLEPAKSDDEDRKRNRHDAEINASFDEPPAKRVPIDAHERSVVRRKPSAKKVDILHFPPTLPVERVIAGKSTAAPTGAIPVSFRPAKKVRGSASAALFRAVQRGVHSITDVLESNTNLVTWPDGTRTLVVGDEQYTIVSDALVSDFYILRKGAGVQTFAAGVGSVGRVQPCSMGGVRAQIARSGAPSGRKPGRKVLRTLEDTGEHDEKIKREQAAKRERERASAEARKRRAMPSSQSSRGRMQEEEEEDDEEPSEEDISEEEADRIAERMPRRRAEASLAHRKAGGGRVIQESDLDDSDSE